MIGVGSATTLAAGSAARRRAPAWRALAPYLGSAAALLLFVGALWLLHHEVAGYRAHDVRRALRALGWAQIGGALALAAASYAVLTLYDVLAFRHLRRRLPYGKIALGAFTSYAFTHSFGFGSLIHATIRYRLYVPLGLRVAEIAEVTAFINVTFMIGLAVIFPVIALIDAPAIEAMGMPHATTFGFGAVGLALAGGYAVLGWVLRRPVRLFGFAFRVPSPSMAMGQIGLSVADLALAAAVLFLCFPYVTVADYPHVLAIFVVALTAGFISHVPGGLGVFDTIVLVGLQDRVPGDAVLAGLLVFRIVYFLIPLLAAGTLFGGLEAMAARRRLRRVSQSLGGWLAPGVPLVMAGCTFAAGAVLLFSNATPEAHYKLRLLYQTLPLPVVESAHFVGSVVGVLLLLVAARLQRRSHGAWMVAMGLLATGAVAAILKGLDWKQALLHLVFFLVLYASREEFYKRSALVTERFTPGWFLAVGVVLGSAFWLGLFSYKHLEDADQLWWRFALFGDASRFIRASVVVAVIALAEAARRLLATARLRTALPGPRALARAAEIVAQSPEARANLALLGDKALLFHPREDAFLMYGVRRRSWIALGDPVGPRERWRDLVCRLAEEAKRHGGWAVFYGISATTAELCTRLGFAVRKIGEEAIVPLDRGAPATLDPELRATHAAIAAACRFEVLDPVAIVPLAPRLKAVADEWLAGRAAKERAFGTGAFAPELLHLSRVGIVRQGERILAFAVLWEAPWGAELLVDIVRHVAAAPEGILDFVLVEAMRWGQEQGYRSFNLGLAPLKGLGRRRDASRWQRLGTYLYGHGEHFHDFLALRRAKARFHPRWEPRFVSSRHGLPLARALPDLAHLIAEAPRAFAAR